MGNKIGRNQPCPCGSGLKFKKCCGGINGVTSSLALPQKIHLQNFWERHRAEERVRETQQGLGRPIISEKFQDNQIVAVRNRIYWSPKWKTFPDFLGGYIAQILGSEWGNTEIAKPIEERHPIMQWYDAYCQYQKDTIKKPGEIHTTLITGIVACYLGLAYNIYLLDHNIELQALLVKRLKDKANFQGAYYELIVASILIRAGFTLELEDETNPAFKHCEFSAVSKHTGKKYWVEAKMKSIVGLMGKNEKDGGSDHDPISQLIPHLNKALAKPASDERLIFIDLNAEPVFDKNNKPLWHDKAIERLEKYETRELKPGVKAYVFITNMAFHRKLNEVATIAAVPFGLGMPDYNRPGHYRLSDIYRMKQKHIDAYNIGDFFVKYLQFPATFDGKMPFEAFGGHSSRIMIGETYFFDDVGENGITGIVSEATVNTMAKEAYIAVNTTDGKSMILRKPMSEGELSDYAAHPDAYFGKVVPVSRKVKDSYEFFEWLVENHKGLSREVLLERLSNAPTFDSLKRLNDTDLLLEYCEGIAASAIEKTRFKTDERIK